MNKNPKRLIRNGPRGKVTTRAKLLEQQHRIAKMAEANKRARTAEQALQFAKGYHSTRKKLRPVRVPGVVNINVTPSPYRNGPYTIKTIKCPRRRNTEMVEVEKRALVDCAGVPIKFGPRKWLDKQLAKYELGYARYIMTVGTEAEGM